MAEGGGRRDGVGSGRDGRGSGWNSARTNVWQRINRNPQRGQFRREDPQHPDEDEFGKRDNKMSSVEEDMNPGGKSSGGEDISSKT